MRGGGTNAATDAPGDLLYQNLQLGPGRPGHVAKPGRGAIDWQILAIGKNHVEVDVQVQRGTEALDQRHRPNQNEYIRPRDRLPTSNSSKRPLSNIV